MFNQYKGLPLALLIFLIVLVVTDFVLRRTTYGRQIFALGGSIEAARRAGISVTLIRVSVFMICGTFAAIGGLFLAGQISRRHQSAGARQPADERHRGGRHRRHQPLRRPRQAPGRRCSACWSSARSSPAWTSKASRPPIQYMITGAVLLAAVVIDSVARRTQKTAGRA